MWRFKTKEEFVKENNWVFSIHNIAGGYPKGWSSDGSMNNLLGTKVPSEFYSKCDNRRMFQFDGKVIKNTDYVGTDSSSFPATTLGENVFFDIERLSKEIDLVFQESLKESKESLEEQCDNMRDYANEIVSLVKSNFRNILEESKDLLLAELAKGKVTINLSDSVHIPVLHTDHPAMVDVVKSLHLYHKAMLVGPAGTGKTYMIAEIAERMKIPFYKYSCSRDSSVHDLIGYKQPRSETYLETVFLKAYENGGIFLVDEYDAMSGDMSLFFNGVADSSKFISIPHRDDKPIARKHKDFYLVMCGNTWGKGSIEYSGRDFQDLALMDRFRLCRHFIGYHETLEKLFMQDAYGFSKDLRLALESVGSYLSTRNVEDISNLINSGVSTKEIVNSITMDLDVGGKKIVLNKVKSYTE